MLLKDVCMGALRSRVLGEFGKYFLASGVALAVDVATFSFCLWVLTWSWPLAAVAGFVAGLTVTYLASVTFIFKARTFKKARSVEILIFAAIGAVGLALTEFLLWFAMTTYEMPPERAKLFSAIGVFLFNYGMRKLILFRLSPPTPLEAIHE